MIRKISLAAAVALLCGLGAGCDSGPGIEVVPVSGVVQLDGTPIDGVSVTLLPDGNGGGKGGYGTSDSNGKFTLQAGPDLNGVPPGSYRVLFTKLALPDGSPIPADAMAADVGAVNMLPERYNNPEFSGVTLTVPPASEADTTFNLTSR